MTEEKTQTKLENALYLVGTPIGNLSDLSPRALDTLAAADFVAAEDTRNSGKLLAYFGIKKPLISYYEHNKRERGQIICDKILAGESCALVTDAGMPAISDPGEDIVALCAELGIKVYAVPGPSAVVTAAALSGLHVGRFCFEGFLSTNRNERNAHLESLKNEKRTMIFYEAPHKLKKTLSDLYSAFGDRKISLCRELTKIYEEVIRTTLEKAVSLYEESEPKGEFVLVLEGASESAEAHFWDNMSIEEHVAYYENTGMKKGDAVKAAAKDRAVPKSEIYSAVCVK